ncbi:hypothetical protein [Vibrio gangliei]|nr:hypothetical protein [Vibrio gangliei]
MTALYVVMGVALTIGLLAIASPYIEKKLIIVEKKLLDYANEK